MVGYQYVEKRFVQTLKFEPRGPSLARCMWDAVQDDDKQLVFRLIVTADGDVNTTFEQAMTSQGSPVLRSVGARRGGAEGFGSTRSSWSGPIGAGSASPSLVHSRSVTSSVSSSPLGGGKGVAGVAASGTRVEVGKDLHGCTLLHLACQVGNLSMVELLLQYGATVNATDRLGRTPLHHCILCGKNYCAKLLLSRFVDSVRSVHWISSS